MKRSIVATSLLLLGATLPGCPSPTDPAEGAPPSDFSPQVSRFQAAETGEDAPIPFRKTGDLYVLETGCDCILAITPAGQVSVAVTTEQIAEATGVAEVSMTGAGIAFDAAGTMFFTENESGAVLARERGGKLRVLASEAAILAQTGGVENDLEGLALDSSGGLYVNDNDMDSVLKVDIATGEVSVLASGKELGALVGLETANLASGLVVGKGDVVFTANEDDPQAIIGIDREEGAAVFATSRLFEGLAGFMTVDGSGDLVIMDTETEVVFKITPDGIVSTFLSETQIQEPIDGEDGRYRGGIAFDGDGNFYLTEAHESHILRFDGRFRGSIWVDRAAIQTATRTTPDLDAGIAFAPLPTD